MKSEEKISEDFNEMLDKIRKKFNFNTSEIYAFTISGK